MNARLVELLTTEKVVERGGEWTPLLIAEARHVARLAGRPAETEAGGVCRCGHDEPSHVWPDADCMRCGCESFAATPPAPGEAHGATESELGRALRGRMDELGLPDYADVAGFERHVRNGEGARVGCYVAEWLGGTPPPPVDDPAAPSAEGAGETADPEELQRRINDAHRRLAEIAAGTGDGTDEEQCRAWVGSEHVYLSTGCLHGEHGYCRAMTGQQGEKRPGRCKFCDARCVCPCHGTSGAGDEAASGSPS